MEIDTYSNGYGKKGVAFALVKVSLTCKQILNNVIRKL